MWLLRSGIVLFTYTGINIYTGIRLFGLVKYFLPSFRSYIFWPLYILFCYSVVWVMLLRFDRIQFLRQLSMYSLPAVVYFFMALLALDLVRLVIKLAGRFPPSPVFSAVTAGIALAFAVITMVYGTFHARDIRTTKYRINLNKSYSGLSDQKALLRIALVSDFHIGATVGRDWIAKIVDEINKTQPDIICIAGDIFDNNLDSLKDSERIIAELLRLRAPLGVYACQGNHDVDRLSLRGGASTDRIYDFLQKANIVLLLDDVEFVAGRFYLIGRRDARPIGLRQERKSAGELVAGEPAARGAAAGGYTASGPRDAHTAAIDLSKPLIFLDHQPVDFPGLEEAGADLILSGHTHNGQFFPGNIATASIFKKSGAAGYGYWRGKTAQGIVTSGAGVWGPPIRIGTISEVAVVEVLFGD